jgi:hypothetical protein
MLDAASLRFSIERLEATHRVITPLSVSLLTCLRCFVLICRARIRSDCGEKTTIVRHRAFCCDIQVVSSPGAALEKVRVSEHVHPGVVVRGKKEKQPSAESKSKSLNDLPAETWSDT